MGEATDQVERVNYVDPAKETSPGVRVPQQNETMDEGDVEATQIRSGIEQTRADLSETIDALQDKLDPARIAEQVKDQIRDKAAEAYDSAKDKVREATIGRVEKIMSNVSETVNDVTGRAGTAVKDTSSSLIQYIRDNPIPFALVGIGVGMMALNKRSAEQRPYVSGRNPDFDDYGRYQSGRGVAANVADTARAAADRAKTVVTSATSTVRDAASSAAETTRQQFDQLSQGAREGARVAGDRLNSTLQDNPIALGVAVLAAGALIGLSLPATRVEGEYMGEARDRLVDQAKSMAREAAEKVQRVTEEAGRTLKDAAGKEGLTVSQTSDGSSA